MNDLEQVMNNFESVMNDFEQVMNDLENVMSDFEQVRNDFEGVRYEFGRIEAEEDNETNRASVMSGTGLVSSGQMTIYYPAGSIGYINILKNGTTVMTVDVNGTGTYTGPLGMLTAGWYSLSLIVMDGTIPVTAAQGTMAVA